MPFMKILVLGGGNSAEREVSLRSSQSVQAGLTALGHDVVFRDAREDAAKIKQAAADCDLVFPILHGTGGEDGTIQRLLDQTGTPYLGSGAEASALCFDKAKLISVIAAAGVNVPAGELVTADSFAQSPLTQRPFVLKPVADGSTVGCYIARQLPYDEAKAMELLEHYGTMLLEELVTGTELTVPVLGEKALPVIEIVPPQGKEFDYENKYNGATAELCPPEHIAAADQARAQRLAEKVHQLAGARHLSRTDMILRPGGELVVLEINTLPGMTSQSLYPKSAAVAGYSWTQLLEQFIKLASTHNA
jgi:D-alanine-D-alanine ligase